MKSRTMFIPGTGGTTLLKNGKSLGHPMVLDLKLWLFCTLGLDIEQTVRDMSMEHRSDQLAPVRTTLAEGATLAPGAPIVAAYNLILSRSDNVFSYDWRGDIVQSATLLLGELEKHNQTKWKIVTHSQGGLVAIVASQLYERAQPKRRFSDLVSHLVMVAPPLSGSINSAHALIHGEDLGQAPSRSFRKIAATWPSLYQMLPRWRAIKQPNGQRSGFHFFHNETWLPYDWVDLELLARAKNLRKKYLDHPAVGLRGVQFRTLLSAHGKTWDHVIRRAETGLVEFPRPTKEGDTLVPLSITLGLMDDVTRRGRVDVIRAGENVPPHSFLLSDDWVVSFVMKALEQ